MTLSNDMEVDPVPEASIINHRSARFLGETQTCDLSELSPQSLEELRWVYRWLETVGEYSLKNLSQSVVLRKLEALVTRDSVDRVVDSVRNVRPVLKESIRVARILHDLRGTALHQAVGLADLWLAGHDVMGGLQAVTILARDHAKVMRHTIIGLDEERRLQDSGQRMHGIENLRNRLPNLKLYNRDGYVQVDFAAEWNGDFATTCPEFTTVLKQLYNLMDNAARHTANQMILVRVYPMTPAEPRSLRLVVANVLTSAERATMSPSVLATLWRGYTTTGSGLGLVASAALVGEAFGLEGPEQAADLGYVGSRVTENGYIAWFHWPLVIHGLV